MISVKVVYNKKDLPAWVDEDDIYFDDYAGYLLKECLRPRLWGWKGVGVN